MTEGVGGSLTRRRTSAMTGSNTTPSEQQQGVRMNNSNCNENKTERRRWFAGMMIPRSKKLPTPTPTPTPAPSFTNDSNNNEPKDSFNYALLIALYTLQGIPMGLSASIPFLIQQKIKILAAAAAASTATGEAAAAAAATATVTSAASVAAAASRLSYNANAIFALCSWPFSLKLLWAPIVDAVFFKRFGRRKSWLVPAQLMAGTLMVLGSGFVENQLGLESMDALESASGLNVKGVTIFFFALYFLMATQDISVDGWALTMLSKKNRGRGPICNSIGQNIGYFMSFVGFLALNDAESSEKLWRPLLGLKSRPGEGLVSLGGFIKFMGGFMLVITTLVALFKSEREQAVFVMERDEVGNPLLTSEKSLMPTTTASPMDDNEDDDAELDASEIGLKETYNRLWAVCQLPAVRWLFLVLLTYRLPCALSDNVKFLKAVEYGMSKSTTALLSPTLILPLGILVPIVAAKLWYGHPLRQFMTAFKIRVTLVPVLDVLMLLAVKGQHHNSKSFFWLAVVSSTAVHAIVNSLQFNAQMTFFANRVDPAIGGSYMTLLNTAANLGGTWPSSVVMYLVGAMTTPPKSCSSPEEGGTQVCEGGRDGYFPLQFVLSLLGCLWIFVFEGRVRQLADLPDEAWKTQDRNNSTNHQDIEKDYSKHE